MSLSSSLILQASSRHIFSFPRSNPAFVDISCPPSVAPPQMTDSLELPKICPSRANRPEYLPSQSTLNGFPSLSLLPKEAFEPSMQTSQIRALYYSSLTSMAASYPIPHLVGSLRRPCYTYSDHNLSTLMAQAASIHPSVRGNHR